MREWDINFIRVDAEKRFLDKLAGVSEPERKAPGDHRRGIHPRISRRKAKKIGKVDLPGRRARFTRT